MVRAPCCEKVGLKKGPWTLEEDRVLISHIQKYGHSNWRALPKQAGLLRCGKSCRLRWINYLRPDIKRGNFTEEEEETIIKLHEMLGNRWSTIAAKLPGRTDNEIKNVWHTHLKKRLRLKTNKSDNVLSLPKSDSDVNLLSESENSTILTPPRSIESSPMSPQPSCSDISTGSDVSTVTAETNSTNINNSETIDSSSEIFPLIDEEFWSEPNLGSNSSMGSNVFGELEFELPKEMMESECFGNVPDIINDDGMDFWYNVFVKAGGIEELI